MNHFHPFSKNALMPSENQQVLRLRLAYLYLKMARKKQDNHYVKPDGTYITNLSMEQTTYEVTFRVNTPIKDNPLSDWKALLLESLWQYQRLCSLDVKELDEEYEEHWRDEEECERAGIE